MIIDTLILLNKTTIRCLNETDEKKIIGIFTELAIRILGASFGFVWMSKKDQEFELAYRSHHLPYTPLTPGKHGRNARVFSNHKVDFVSVVDKGKGKFQASRYMKNFAIIPIAYRDNIYGNMVICFRSPDKFSKEKQILSALIGSNLAQIITILHNRKMQKANEEYRRKTDEEGLRTEFLADAMHELRTPLAVIKGTVDLARKSSRLISQSAALKAINGEIQHLVGILGELSLLTSKDSLAQRKILTKKIQLVPSLKRMSKRWKILAHKKNITIRVEKIPFVSILADESYLNKLFSNVVKNAINYGNERGHIYISGKIQDDTVIIDIKDDGIGISQDDIGRIFDRFYRADKSRSNYGKDNGTGLGLAITKWIANAHGGDVTVNSTIGKGSTFSVSLPFV